MTLPKSLLLSATLLTAVLPAAGRGAALPRRNRAILLTGATLIDGTGAPPVADSWIFIRDGKFTDVSTLARKRGRATLAKDVRVIDASGKWIVPGFVDAHVHVAGRGDSKTMIRWGVTAARLMGEDVARSEDAAARSRGRRQSPVFFPACPIFTVRGGWWSEESPDAHLDRFPKSSAGARAAVERARELGSTEIKIMLDDMSWCRDPLPKLARMDDGIVRALAESARSFGMRVAVHAPQEADAALAVDAGASLLAHGVLDAPIRAETIEKLKASGGFYVPTLDIFDFLADPKGFMERALSDRRIRESLPIRTLALYRSADYFETYRRRYPNAAFVAAHLTVLEQNLRSLKEADVRVALGTDMWAFPGAGVHIELEEFVHAGYSPLEAIHAATLVSAESLGEGSRRGSVEAGKLADFVILENDPASDIRNTRAIDSVYRGGRLAWSRYRRVDEE